MKYLTEGIIGPWSKPSNRSMSLEEKRELIEAEQKWIDLLPYTPTISYPFCCRCFERLTEHNIVEKEDGLWDVCLDCENK